MEPISRKPPTLVTTPRLISRTFFIGSPMAWIARPASRRSPRRVSQDDLVDVAPGPLLPGLERAHDGMAGAVEVRRSVPVRRGVAAADVSARQAESQVHPARADPQAVLAAARAGMHAAGLGH